jgi:hypothetical protein
MGDIYCLTSPSNKKYIGQCVKNLSSGKQWGYLKRWHQHCYESKTNKGFCRLLDNAIRKYNPNSFKVELLVECSIEELDYYEQYYIIKYNTLTPNGYNLTTGKSESRQSEETKIKRSESMIGKNKGKSLHKRSRQREEDNNLPKYLRSYNDSSGKSGYRISNHPILKDKSFLSKKISDNDKLNLALEYLSLANKR